MRTRVERRIGGEMVAMEATVGALEALAAIEDSIAIALARLRQGSVTLTRVAVREMTAAAGRPRSTFDAWYDEAVERCGLAPFATLAFEALADAYAKAAQTSEDLEGNPAAAMETATDDSGSTD